MAAEIIERIINSDYDKIIRIAGGEIVRPLEVGSNWDSGQLLIRCAVNGATLSATAIQVGWVNGTNNTLARYTNGDVASVNNLVSCYNQAAATYVAGTPNYFHSGSNMWTRKLVGTTSTNYTFSNLTSTDRWMSGSPDTNRMIFGIQLNKSNPASIISGMVFQEGSNTADVNMATFYRACEGTFPTSYRNSPTTAGTLDEATNGGLDTVFVYFNDTTGAELEISDVCFTRFI